MLKLSKPWVSAQNSQTGFTKKKVNIKQTKTTTIKQANQCLKAKGFIGCTPVF